ncbi:MAG: hypothetical protein KatS3mg002_1536 [Candidatus Woesearchaeota archaeon]|nr:MAG: hypothetical protein KatS3mg002_1536 [Candidatus Woesearchaeota archaeon]
MLILLSGSVYAIELSDACTSRGFNYTISSWVWDNGYINVQGSNVDVWGNARKAYWNSTIFIDGVVYKSANRTYLLIGGFNGTVPKTTLSNDMQWMAFCSNTYEIPEFTIIGLLIIIAYFIFFINSRE